MARCSHCGARKAKFVWDMRPCALGRNVRAELCEGCDVALNGLVLAFLGVSRPRKHLQRYRRRLDKA
jgi:hypothetical protein